MIIIIINFIILSICVHIRNTWKMLSLAHQPILSVFA